MINRDHAVSDLADACRAVVSGQEPDGAGVASQRIGARRRAKGMDGMSRTNKSVGTRERGPTRATITALVAVVALALAWGVAPALADTAPAATPTTVATVAPTTVATVAPTTVATVAPVSVGVVGSRAAALKSWDQCATSTATSLTCPIQMSLVATNEPPISGDGWRVGDVINLQLKIENKENVAKKVIALSAGMDFNPDELGLVAATSPYAPVPTTTSGVGTIFDRTSAPDVLKNASTTAQGVTNSSTAYINKNKFKLEPGDSTPGNDKNGTDNNNPLTYQKTGKIDLDFEILGAANAISLGAADSTNPSPSVIIGEISVRVQKNPSSNGTYTIKLRGPREAINDDYGDMYRNSVVLDGTNSEVIGRSILGKVVNADLSVKRTEVTVSLAVATPSLSPEGRGHRVGDTIAVDVVAEATGTGSIARNATSMDLVINVDSSKFVLVDGSGSDVKALATPPVVKPATTNPAFGQFTSKKAGNSTTCEANNSTNNAYGGASGVLANKITLNLDGADGAALDLRPGTDTVKRVVGRFWVRPNYNGTADQTERITIETPIIGIREYDANCAATTRFQVATAKNIASPAGDIVVKPTTVNVKLAPDFTTQQRDVIRVGDLIKVKYLIDTTDAKYVNTIRTTITYQDTDLILVDSQMAAISTGDAVSVLTTGTSDIAGATATGTNNRRATTGVVSTITLNVVGNDNVLETASGKVVGTFWVRPLRKIGDGGLPITIATANAYETLPGDGRGQNFQVGNPLIDATAPKINNVRGTIGVSLEARSPLASNTADDEFLAGNDDRTGQTWVANGTAGALQVVDGRYLDVRVKVDAGSSSVTAKDDAKKADVFNVDIQYDKTQLTFGAAEIDTGSGTTVTTNAVLAKEGLTVYAVSTGATKVAAANESSGGNAVLSLRLKVPSGTLLTESKEIARLRFKVNASQTADTADVTFRGADSTGLMKVLESTVIRQSGTAINDIFVDDLYADPITTAEPLGEFDRLPNVTRAKPATLQIGALLQGRPPVLDSAVSDPNDLSEVQARFVQPIVVELRQRDTSTPFATTSAQLPVTRRRTVTNTPSFVKQVTSNPVPDMQYAKTSAKRATGVDATFDSALDDLEPGTYDVYVKGKSSIGVVVLNVVFDPGQKRDITGLVLREGDLDNNNKVDSVDFTAFTPYYHKNVASNTDKTALASDLNKSPDDIAREIALADMNQSGYVDILDFSLLGYNYGKEGPFCAPSGDACGVNGQYVWGAETGKDAAVIGARAMGGRGANQTASLDVTVGPRDSDGIAAVNVAVTPGSRAVDGVQVNLKTASGVQVVDAPTGGTFAPAEANPMPVILQQAWDAARSIVNLGLGRAPSATGLTDPTTLGTIFVKIPAGFTGSPITIERTDGLFRTTVASAGTDVTGNLNVTVAGATASVDTGTVVVDQPAVDSVVIGGTDLVITAPAPARILAPSIGAPMSLAPVAQAPAVAAAPARTSAPAPTSRASVSAPTRSPFAPVMIENRAKGTLTLVRPGSGAVELKTGLATTSPDAFCPVARHKTYIRLEDTGIAGATFGVEAGGVLSWVTPDQAGCVDWNAISDGGLTFTKETIMQFQLAQAVPGALLWVLDGNRHGELYEVDANGVANYVTADAFAANQDHFTEVWANVIPVSTAQITGLAARGSVNR